MRRHRSIVCRGFGIVVWLAGCVETIEPDPNHCMHNDGDAFCAERHWKTKRRFCGYASCYASVGDGCVEERPVEVWQEQLGNLI